MGKHKNGSHALVQSLADMAAHVTSLDILTRDEKEEQRQARADLLASVDALSDIFRAHDALQMGDQTWDKAFDPNGPMLLASALTAAFRIGTRAVENPIMKRIEREANKAKIQPATRARSERSKMIDDEIGKRIKPIYEKQPNLKPGIVARRIFADLNKKIAPPIELDTIQRKIKKLRMTVR